MTDKDKIEITRNILNNAVKINISKELLLKISQKLDKYIVEYYRNEEKEKVKILSLTSNTEKRIFACYRSGKK